MSENYDRMDIDLHPRAMDSTVCLNGVMLRTCQGVEISSTIEGGVTRVPLSLAGVRVAGNVRVV